MRRPKLTFIIDRQNSVYVAMRPQIDVASQGDTILEARENIQDAVELFFECAGADEIRGRLMDNKSGIVRGLKNGF